jgi:hypothetical protein
MLLLGNYLALNHRCLSIISISAHCLPGAESAPLSWLDCCLQRDRSEALLAAERAEVEAARRAKAKAERDLMAALEAGRQEVEAMRQQGEADLLTAKAEQVKVDKKIRLAANMICGQGKASKYNGEGVCILFLVWQEQVGSTTAVLCWLKDGQKRCLVQINATGCCGNTCSEQL